MIESRDDYGYIDKEEKDITFFKEQKSESIKEKGWQFIIQQVKNEFKERKSLRSTEFRKVCRERVNRFRYLSSIEPDFKVSHFRKVCRHIVKIAKVDFREEFFLKNEIKCLYVLGILGTISPNWILTGSVLKKISLFNWIGVNVFYLGVISTLSFLISFILRLQSSKYENSKYEKIIAVLFSIPTAAICATIFRDIKHADDSFFAMFPLISIVGLIFSILISILLAEVIWIINMFLTQPRKQYSESILVNGLLEVLSRIEKESLYWSYDARAQIWCKIKGLAKNLQNSYPGAFSNNKTFSGIGCALYAYEAWLDDPKKHTYEDLKVRIAEKFKYSVCGHLGEIEKSYSKGLSLKQISHKLALFASIVFTLSWMASAPLLWPMITPSLLERVPEVKSVLDSTEYVYILRVVYILIAILLSAPFFIYSDSKELFKEIVIKTLSGFLPKQKD